MAKRYKMAAAYSEGRRIIGQRLTNLIVAELAEVLGAGEPIDVLEIGGRCADLADKIMEQFDVG